MTAGRHGDLEHQAESPHLEPQAGGQPSELQEANQVNLSLCESLNLKNLEEETEAEAIEEGYFLVYTSSFPNCILAPRTPISGGNPACSELGFPSSIIKQEHVAQACPWDIMEGAFTQLGLPLAK